MNLEKLPAKIQELDSWIADREDSVNLLKPQAKASVIWADPKNKSKTPFSILYLHGFKASHGEGDPTHKSIAKKLGCNLYLSRLIKHGLEDPDAFKNLRSSHLIHSAEESLQIANQLGNKVIIMGTSTGASLALYLASKKEYKDSVAALLLYSPLIKFYGLQNMMLANSLGRSMLRLITGKNFQFKSQNQTQKQENIWYSSYHIDGVLALGEFVESYMNLKTFSEVSCPVFTAYYYKSFFMQDKVVSVQALKKMHENLGTPPAQKEIVQLPDAGTHIISSGLVSKAVPKLEKESVRFLRKQLAHK